MEKIVLALGYFDALHIGHQKIIDKTIELSKRLNAKPALFTFDGDLSAYFNKTPLQIFTKAEKERRVKGLGIDLIVYAPLTNEYISKSKNQFLDDLNTEYDIVGYVCGDDFRFGHKAQGNTDDLRCYSITHNQVLEVVDEVSFDKNRVSTTLIKEYLKLGEIEKANELLGTDYFVTGKVVKGRGDGKKMGIPTVNVLVEKEKFLPKNGVYGGLVSIDNIDYKAVINYGNAPTFDFDKQVLEFFIVDFNGDLYDRKLQIRFTKFIRDIRKFSSKEELKNQILKDVESL